MWHLIEPESGSYLGSGVSRGSENLHLSGAYFGIHSASIAVTPKKSEVGNYLTAVHENLDAITLYQLYCCSIYSDDIAWLLQGKVIDSQDVIHNKGILYCGTCSRKHNNKNVLILPV